jgi:hypothetical protein
VLRALLGNEIREVEFSDDRLANLLDNLGNDVAHPNKSTTTPTACSIFKKFCREKINLSQINIAEKNYWNLSRIGEDLVKVLMYLKIPLEIYKADYYKNWHPSN